MNAIIRCLAAGLLITMASCSKTQTYPTASLNTYYPLAVGKYILYRMDSLVFVNYGQTAQIHSYLAKDTCDGIVLDNLGDTTYRIHRLLTDTAYANPWQDDITYTVGVYNNTIQVVENNLRYIKITAPFTTNLTWNGDSYLGNYPFQSYYGTLAVQTGVQYWMFNYENIGQSYTVGQTTVPNTITVQQNNDSTNLPLPNDSVYASKTYGLEVYGAGIGLIYKSFILWDFQPVTPNQAGYYEGFGVTMYMLGHN